MLNPDELKAYYDKHFPVEDFTAWLAGTAPGEKSKAASSHLAKRELSFTLPGDIYCRYQSFPGANELRTALTTQVPEKIDVGAVFNTVPSRQQAGLLAPAMAGGGLVALERELVFDIDMDDYDEVRTCCKGARICPKCWTFIACAVTCLREALTQDFGFKHLMFVFSGRRGVHCWVCDESARLLTNEQRAAVAENLNLMGRRDADTGQRVYLSRGDGKAGWQPVDQPAIKRAARICERYMELPENGFVFGQETLSYETGVNGLVDGIRKRMPKAEQGSAEKFDEFLTGKPSASEVFSVLKRLASTKREFQVLYWEVLFECLYPRLDINVSKQRNHLLKAPFCVHPKSLKISVPILDPDNPSGFDPCDKCPTLADVVRLPPGSAENPLARYREYFRGFVKESAWRTKTGAGAAAAAGGEPDMEDMGRMGD